MAASTIDTEFPGLTAALAGAYRIERELGRGGMGVVFLARDERLDRAVALKVLPPALANDPVVRERFLREARTAAQLSHPNIVPVYSADHAGGWAYFAMAYIDGESLGERIASLGPLPPAEVVRLMRDAAWALAYAHARGVVHRDVKPDNLLIERGTSRLVVTDFGIAFAPDASPLTQTGLVMGSVHFMSPEQGAGEELDGRSDLYALGTVGFLALSGRLPFLHDQASAILVHRATRAAPSLRAVAPDVPAPIADVIDQCLDRDPARRPSTGEALAERLERAREDAAAMEATSRPQLALSETDANLVWRRAAQLQAEAAARLEARTRQLRAGPGIERAAGDHDGTRDASGAYRVEQVESAAEEAGISRQFVAVALAELKSDRGDGKALKSRASHSTPVVRVILGKHPRTISVTRTFDHPPREVLAAMGVALQRIPAGLRLRETLGAHALHGGVLVFDLPIMEGYGASGHMSVSSNSYLWSWTRYQMWVKTLRVQLTAEAGNSSRCVVTLSIELPEGYYASLWEAAGFGAGGGAVGSLVGAILMKKAVLLTLLGFPAALPLLAGGVAVGTIGNRLLYQHAVRKSRGEMEAALDEIAREFTNDSVFGDPFG
ncbi:MAG: serine/threonine-protein kinase, partial [Gemmatimonadota bacterium]